MINEGRMLSIYSLTISCEISLRLLINELFRTFPECSGYEIMKFAVFLG